MVKIRGLGKKQDLVLRAVACFETGGSDLEEIGLKIELIAAKPYDHVWLCPSCGSYRRCRTGGPGGCAVSNPYCCQNCNADKPTDVVTEVV